jgi:hypothetical protein
MNTHDSGGFCTGSTQTEFVVPPIYYILPKRASQCTMNLNHLGVFPPQKGELAADSCVKATHAHATPRAVSPITDAPWCDVLDELGACRKGTAQPRRTNIVLQKDSRRRSPVTPTRKFYSGTTASNVGKKNGEIGQKDYE